MPPSIPQFYKKDLEKLINDELKRQGLLGGVEVGDIKNSRIELTYLHETERYNITCPWNDNLPDNLNVPKLIEKIKGMREKVLLYVC